MFWEKTKLCLRRAVAWWIDAFLAAAIILLVRWILQLIGIKLDGTVGAVYDIVSFAVVFYAYRVLTEATRHTSLGKWSLRLEIVGPQGFRAAAIRNAWVLLTLLALTGLPFVEPIIVAVLGLSVLIWGRHPFDMLAGVMVLEKLPDEIDQSETQQRPGA